MVYTDSSGNSYSLSGLKALHRGEGTTYFLPNSKVIKIYHATTLSSNPNLEKKIRFMKEHPPSNSILKYMAWPIDMIYEDGHFCGFMMNELKDYQPLTDIHSYSVNSSEPLQLKLQVALNICMMTDAIHSAGYTIGDFNPENIGYNKNTGSVCFYDIDSYQFTDPSNNVKYRCSVMFTGYVAPEILIETDNKRRLNVMKGITKQVTLNDLDHGFDQETDRFALSVHMFQLLNNGMMPNSCIPANSAGNQGDALFTPGKSSAVVPQTDTNVIEGHYSYSPGYIAFSISALRRQDLPDYIVDMFDRSFGRYTYSLERPTSADWIVVLTRYHDDIIKCSKDRHHLYYKNLKDCPYCEANERKRSFNIKKPNPTPVPPPSPTPPAPSVSPVQQQTQTQVPPAPPTPVKRISIDFDEILTAIWFISLAASFIVSCYSLWTFYDNLVENNIYHIFYCLLLMGLVFIGPSITLFVWTKEDDGHWFLLLLSCWILYAIGIFSAQYDFMLISVPIFATMLTITGWMDMV